jgi:uncharacterized protein (DUF433 family)
MDRIEVNPDICNGKAIIKGTRITVATILGFLSAGDSYEDILEAYPSISKEDIMACLQYAHKIVNNHSAIKTA